MGDIPTGDFVNIILAGVGESVTLVKQTMTQDSDWGSSATETTASTATITAVIQDLNERDQLVIQGNAKLGDAKAWFDPDDSVAEGDKITWNSNDFRVTQLKSSPVEKAYYKTAILVRIE